MSRKTETVVTLQVRVRVLPKHNTAEIADQIRQLLQKEVDENAVVKLVKKETSYA